MATQRICTKCNAILEDGSRFCQECGAKVEVTEEAAQEATQEVPEETTQEAAQEATQEVPEETTEETAQEAAQEVPEETVGETIYETLFCPECGSKITTEFAFCPECGKTISGEKKNESEVIELPDNKKNLPSFLQQVKPLYIGVAAIVVVLFLAAIAVFSGGGSSAGKKHIIYARDNELQFSNLSDMKPFQLTDRFVERGTNVYAEDYLGISSYVLMSEDDRYAFYPDRFSGDGLTYYWRDLNAANQKEGTATKVDSEITQMPYLTNDGSKFYYTKGEDDRLYVYDRKTGEKNKLDDDVMYFYINEAGNYLIYSAYKDGENYIYEMTMKGLTGEKNKIDSNAEIRRVYVDEKKVYYLKEDVLFLKEYNKEKVRIASDVERVLSVIEGSAVYYLKSDETTNKLSDFIIDDMIADDKNISEPAYPDLPKEPEKPKWNDYREDVWYASSWGSERHPDTDERGYWLTESDDEAFSKANEQYKADYNVWKTETDSLRKEYTAAMELYQAKLMRDDLRAAFDDEENAVTNDKYDLYYWTPSGDSLVASDVALGMYQYSLASSSKIPAIVYQKYDTSSGGSKKLSELYAEVSSYGYVSSMVNATKNSVFETRNVAEEIYIMLGDKESTIDCNNAFDWFISKNGTLYFLDDYNEDKDYGVLMSAKISGNSLEKPTKIDEDVAIFRSGNNNENIFYYKDVKSGVGDLYLNGKQLATDVYMESLYNFKGKDTLLYFKDYSIRADKGMLCMLKGGKETKIFDDVSFFVAVDEKNVAFITEYNVKREKGDLMHYKEGGKPTLIDSDVTALLQNPKMSWGTSYDYMYSIFY